MKIIRNLLLSLIGFVVFVVGGFFLVEWINFVDIDQTSLEALTSTEGYEALFRRLEQNPPAPEGFTFVALGDSRTHYDLAKMILQRAAEENPAFILSNGDIVERGTVGEYLEYHLKLMREIAPIPFIVVPGNHEKGPNRDFSSFKALYGDERFSFGYGNCRFVGVNNGDRTKLGWSDLRYLREELSKPGAQYKFVTLHSPPEFLEEALNSQDTRGFTWNAKKLHELMVEQEVVHVFAGHVHGFGSRTIDGVQYSISGGAGAGLTDKLGEQAMVHNFIVTRITPDDVETSVLKYIDDVWQRESME